MDSTPVPRSFQKVLVVGLGITGAAVTEALLDLGRDVRVAEKERGDLNNETARRLARLGVEVVFGEPDSGLAEWADLVVPSPGVPPSNRLLAAASRLATPIWSEIELGWRLARGPVIAITGTNGKTTTTELLTSILKKADLPAVAAGNIGFPLVKAARMNGEGTIFVTEVSSFQLAYVDRFRPQVAVVLNVAHDHYDWHSHPADYLAAKARITRNQQAQDLLLVSGTDEGARSIAANSTASIGVFGALPPASLRREVPAGFAGRLTVVAGIENETVVISSSAGEVELMKTADIRLAGSHNLENVLSAAAAAFHWMGSHPAIPQAVHEFDALPHRMSLVAEKDGTRYIDDSKATNPHAALAALSGLDNVILIAGGRSKGIPLLPLASAASACKTVIVMGEAAAELRDIFKGLPVLEAYDVEDAVGKAAQIAGPGDTVLLSPGCSSLDQYRDYADRGDRFVQAVRALP